MMKWLLAFVPIAILLDHFMADRPMLVFAAAALAIVPLAGWMGEATEHLAAHTGESIGGLLSATFGNAAELIIAIVALRAGLHDVVKASLAGAIVGNMLFVLGTSMLAGGIKHHELHFNPAGARSQATMLTLAVIALILPAAYHAVSQRTHEELPLGELSMWVSIALLIVYALNLVFSLVTHKAMFANEDGGGGEHEGPAWGAARSVGVLAAATVGIAWISEILVGAIEPTAKALGLNDAFVGVFVLAVLGGAAEQAIAVGSAVKGKMNLAFSIAIGSSVQIALFVAPSLVLVSYFVGPGPMDLAFSGGLVLSILLAVLITGQIASDGQATWLKGVQLLAVYVMLALAFYFVPAHD